MPDTTNLKSNARVHDRREHFGLVVDEYGVPQGLVTLEDIWRDLGASPKKTNQHIPRASAPGGRSPKCRWLDACPRLNRELEWICRTRKTTIAGLVIHEARVIPEAGQVFSFFGFKFEILRRQRNQIMALRITPPKPEPVDDSG